MKLKRFTISERLCILFAIGTLHVKHCFTWVYGDGEDLRWPANFREIADVYG